MSAMVVVALPDDVGARAKPERLSLTRIYNVEY